MRNHVVANLHITRSTRDTVLRYRLHRQLLPNICFRERRGTLSGSLKIIGSVQLGSALISSFYASSGRRRRRVSSLPSWSEERSTLVPLMESDASCSEYARSAMPIKFNKARIYHLRRPCFSPSVSFIALLFRQRIHVDFCISSLYLSGCVIFRLAIKHAW